MKVALLLLVACSSESPAAPSPSAKPSPKPPTAAQELAKKFAKDLVGTIVPIAPTADTYAMSLELRFETFVTMELRLDDSVTGAWRMTLANDGSATGCIGVNAHHVSDGQYHYEPDPAKRQHSSNDDIRLVAIKGTWKVTDTIATIQFDQIAWRTCDTAKVTSAGQNWIAMRCIGIEPPAHVSEKRLACELDDKSQSFDLGMPMTPESRKDPGRVMSAPQGRQLVFGAPGLQVKVDQDSHAKLPSFTFTPGAVEIKETDFVKPAPTAKPRPSP